MAETVKYIRKILLESMAIHSKTLHYHWNVEGANFMELHKMLQEQYENLAEAIDEIAERIRALNEKALVTEGDIAKEKYGKDPNVDANWFDMISDLLEDHENLINILNEGIKLSQNEGDEVTADLFIERMQVHQKFAWMLRVTIK